MLPKITFHNKSHNDFVKSLNKKISFFFKENNISKYANFKMVFKGVIMFLIYLIPYALIISNLITGFWLLLLAAIMGIGMAGIGMSVMHDANHNAYSSKQKINNWIGYCIYMIGGDVYSWKMQHNILHHTFTNIDGLDGDLKQDPWLRLSLSQNWRWIHKFQHLYAFPLYSLGTIFWVVFDVTKFFRFSKKNFKTTTSFNKRKEFSKLLFFKIVYLFFVFILPILLTDIMIWQIIIGWAIMNLIAGFILTTTFQLAHLVEGVSFPVPKKGSITNAWKVHQLLTTANFATKSRIVTWFIGGLNFQIEHHLFPTICHIHYKKISKIVKETALEFGLQYNHKKSMFSAIQSHYKMLKTFGQKPTIVV